MGGGGGVPPLDLIFYTVVGFIPWALLVHQGLLSLCFPLIQRTLVCFFKFQILTTLNTGILIQREHLFFNIAQDCCSSIQYLNYKDSRTSLPSMKTYMVPSRNLIRGVTKQKKSIFGIFYFYFYYAVESV